MQQVAAVADVACNKNARIKAAAAARRLGLNRSSLKRYLDRYPELVDQRGLVDFDVVKKHRDDNPQISDALAESEPRMRAEPMPSDGGSRKGNRNRLEEIKTWEAERDYAKDTGQLVDPSAIIDAISEAGVALRDKLMAPDPDLCERMAGSDPRTVATLWREENRKLLADFLAALKRVAGGSVEVKLPEAAEQERADV
jgi:hypothetical protein